MATTLQVFPELDVPVEPDKYDSPATVLTIVGIELDTTQMELQLTIAKFHHLKHLIATWRGQKC